MASNVQTKTASRREEVINVTVIRFIDAPHYRNNDVDISDGDTLRLFGIERLTRGNNQGGLRAKVPHTEIPTGRCELIIENRDFEVIVNYTGPVSVGIEGH